MVKNKLLVHITLESPMKPEMERSPSRVIKSIQNIITQAVQLRFPEYDVQIGRLEGQWPDSDKEFTTIDTSKY